MKIAIPTRLALVVCALAFGSLCLPVAAAPGDLDLTFGGGTGKVTTAVGSGNDTGRAVAVQSDGKIVMAGFSNNGTDDDFAVVRYNANGSLDTSFGTAGKVTTAIGAGNDRGLYMVLQADEKIVVVGSAVRGGNTDFAVVRYNTDGSLDTNFGSGGKVTTVIGSSTSFIIAQAVGAAVQQDGKIVVVGHATNGSTYDFAMVRYNTDGSLDTNFGSAGKVLTALGSSADYAEGVVVQGDGKIVVAGYSNNGSDNDFAVVRYNADGSLDTSFGNTGKVTTAVGVSFDHGKCVALQSDGKIVVAGTSHLSNLGRGDFALVRYNSDGSLDESFGNKGTVVTVLNGNTSSGLSIALQNSGKIVVAGNSGSGAENFAIARYNTDGSLDQAFGDKGKRITDIGGLKDSALSVALQSDGKIIAAGWSESAINSNDFALARYEGDSTLPSVTTGTATEITTTSARLSGTVNPKGSSTSVAFETARDTVAYTIKGNVVAEQSPLSGSAAQSVTATKTGLLPHTTYKFRVSATNADGTSVGSDVTFTTGNSAPVAGNDEFHRSLGQLAELPVLANDSDADWDAVFITSVTDGAHGTVAINSGGVTLTYYPGPSYRGNDTFTYTISDGYGGTATATVALKNTSPAAVADAVTIPARKVAMINVVANDTDPEGDELELLEVTAMPESSGTAVSSGGKITYTPDPDFLGTTQFSYRIQDSAGGQSVGTLSLLVEEEHPIVTVLGAKGTPVPGAGEPGSSLEALPSGSTWAGFGVPSINADGQVAFLGKVKQAQPGSLSAIFAGDPQTPALIVKQGDAAPGLPEGATFHIFKDPLFNAEGAVAFLATAKKGGKNSASLEGIWSNAFSIDGKLQLVAYKGAQPPGVPTGARWKKFVSVAFTGREVVAVARMATGPGKVKSSDDMGVWAFSPEEAGSRLLLREGQEISMSRGSETVRKKVKAIAFLGTVSGAPGQGGALTTGRGSLDSVPSFYAVKVTFPDRTQAVLYASTRPSGETSGWEEAFLATGDLHDKHLETSRLPDARFEKFGIPSVTRGGAQIGFLVTLKTGAGGVTPQDSQGIYLDGVQVRAGGPAVSADGALWKSFREPVFGNKSEYAFIGTLARSKGKVKQSNDTGIWWQPASGPMQLVAREGAQPPGVPEGARWAKFTSLALPGGQTGPLFVGAMVNQKKVGVTRESDIGLWAVDSTGLLRLLVREGDPVDLGGITKTLRSFTVLSAVSGSPGQVRSFNQQGEVVYHAYFTDSTQAVVKVRLP